MSQRRYSLWDSIVRLSLGIFWFYFGYQKWFDNRWVFDVLLRASQENPIMPVKFALQHVILPNWQGFTTAYTVLETLIGLLLVIGLFAKFAAYVGTLLAATLAIVFAQPFPDLPLWFWFYIFNGIINISVAIRPGAGYVSLNGFLGKKRKGTE